MRGETEIEKVVGCARRGEAEKVNKRIGAKHETRKTEKVGIQGESKGERCREL